ncbi:MAG: hypothetical protein Q7T80_13240, partial [Methanoregula sp.]|nr:hypothetical protein [Methanoregula sp.]
LRRSHRTQICRKTCQSRCRTAVNQLYNVEITGSGGIIIRKWIAAFIIILFVALALSGCLGIKTPSVSRPIAPAVVVDYQRAGGIAGLDDRLVIFDNGVAVISRKTISTEIVLNQSDLDRITKIFNDAQYSMLEGNYSARRGTADYFRYTINYHSKKVIAEDSAIPPSLQPVIDEMTRIVNLANSGERIARPFANLPS